MAESLYWIGRYLERADDTARLLDVQINRLLEDTPSAEARVSTAILAVMGVTFEEDPDRELTDVIARIGFSRTEGSSIISSLRGARDNARGIRESISSELWECLNSTILDLDAQIASAQAVGPHEFFRFSLFVRERVAIAGGTIDAAMARDDGWRFLILGRSIERVDMTSRLLRVRLADSASAADWATTLRTCSAYEAFLRTYRGAMNFENAVEFLVLDRYFPRSVHACLVSAQSSLDELESGRAQAGSGEAQRVIGRARTRLEYLTLAELASQLPEHLAQLQQDCFNADAAIARHYFQRDATLTWRTDNSSVPISDIPA